MDNKNIILIGFMGSGKTTFGKWMEAKHKKTLIDTDEYIVHREGRSVNDIFAAEGEAYFRELETETLRELLAAGTKNAVLSAGGGMPLRAENGELLRQLGTVVYLRTGIDILVKRLTGDKKRPLLAGGDLRGKIERLMESRAGIYADRADLILDTDNASFEKLYERIQEYETACNKRSES